MHKVQPLFKSNYSVGKSIFTYETPDKDFDEDGPPSIVKLCKENGLKDIYIVEDSMTAFPEAFKKLSKEKIDFCYGMRFFYGDEENSSKAILFGLNDASIKILNKFHTEFFTKGVISNEFFVDNYTEDLALAIPFYDSFLFRNNFEMKACGFDLEKYSPLFFLENNGLPFDEILHKIVLKYCKQYKFETQEVKSIYYEKREDAEALQTLKMITSRGGYKKPSLSKPNLDHFGSREFCFESWKENHET